MRHVALLLLLAAPAAAQDEAACTLAGGSHAEATLSPPGGEDEDFLGLTGGGLPYIAFVIDTSAHMRRFPVDLISPTVRAQGLGCANAALNALTYQANPCIDGKGLFVNYAAAGCSASTMAPAGFGQPYQRAHRYAPYDSDLSGLFRSDRFYVHDRGWGVSSTVVGTSWVKTSALDACVAAGVPSAEQSACAACVSDKGYYLPADEAVPPALSGSWINFNPPKYVIARKLLKDQFAALDAPSRTRQTMLTLVEDTPERCYSANRGSTGMDARKDGATLIANPTTFKPPCGQFLSCVHNGSSGGGRAAFDNMVNKESALFTDPSGRCPAGAPVPSEAPPGTASVRFAARADGTCRGAFVGGAGEELGEAVCAPYAEALLNAGQYLGDQGLYDALFPSTPAGTWRKSELDALDSVCPALSCGCPQPTLILLAGGGPGFDDNLPCEITGDGCASTVPPPKCGTREGTARSRLAKVARFLATINLKPNEAYNSPARVTTHVIAFGTEHPDLVEAAKAGKGGFFSADTASELRSALNEALTAATITQYSFSNASVSAVQTRASTGVLVPRFTPSEGAFWSGKLAQYKLVNEDTCGCREPAQPGDPCDYNQDGLCGGVFFQDADGDFIAADGTGAFRKARLQGGVFLPGARDARPVWEASKGLAGRSAAAGAASSRKVLTVLDSNGDGLLDFRDEVISFDEGSVARLLPYLNLGTGSFCSELSAQLGTCLSPTQCATKVIQFVRGADVLDEDCDGNTSEDRQDKLGDIFHSSPVLVDPPLSTQSVLCQLGLSSQCLMSLTATPTPLVDDAFERYVARHKHRDKVVLVGANDGMLHAFRGGRWLAADNPETAQLDECPSPDDCTGYYDLGDGEELWAFIPPDLLPKLQRLLQVQHQYFVDGTAMVRDVWADENGNGRKEEDEFHTLAVVGERRGGTHFFALDVTRPEGPEQLPSAGFFRWLHPQPNTAEARTAGQSYSEFLPSPPPIGPVRLKTSGPAAGTHKGSPYEERWIVMLSGGFDQANVRGRSVSMVDVWRGGALWRFDPGLEGHSFAAAPAMVGFGASSTNPSRDPNEYFFDTATVGDVGGQLWTLRFNDPDPSRWAGAKLFQSAAGDVCGRQPFFHITANTIALRGGHLRTLAGTGDRFNLADRAAGACSADNLVGCLRRGCRLVQEVTRTVCGRTASFRREYQGANSADACALSPNVFTVDSSPGTDCCSSSVLARAAYTLSCTNRDGSPVTVRWEPSVSCQAQGASVCGSAETQFVCEASNDTPFDICGTFDRCDEPITPPPSGFYSVKVFDEASPARAVFDDAAGAARYGGAALTATSLVQVDPYTPSAARALPSQSGWHLSYGFPDPPGHVFPQTPAAFDGQAVNERTATQAVIVGGCAVFSTTTPGSSSGVCQPRSVLATTTYYLNFLSGGPCAGLDAALAQPLTHRRETEPPAPPQVALDITPSGKVNLKLAGISRSSGGAARTTPVMSDLELVKSSYRLPVTRPLHACRHPEGSDVASQRASANAGCEVRR